MCSSTTSGLLLKTVTPFVSAIALFFLPAPRLVKTLWISWEQRKANVGASQVSRLPIPTAGAPRFRA